jgi:hypothetical protein
MAFLLQLGQVGGIFLGSNVVPLLAEVMIAAKEESS